MCYSAQIEAEYKKYVRVYGARIDMATYAELFWGRLESDRIKIPKAVEQGFAVPQNDQERNIQEAIDRFKLQQASQLEQELFKQRKRLADAQRSLLAKPTKAATEAQRISTNKIGWVMSKLADLRRTELAGQDSRIYPGYYAPVIVFENGERVVKPMRYQCRPAGKPVAYDNKYPGTYNARRDNLEGFWKGQFGYTHGVMVVNAFYEHVSRPVANAGLAGASEPTENVILEFRPRPEQSMLVACLWSHWKGQGEPDLYSFAAITDEPPSEIAAAGHDRCVIPLKPESLDGWLRPDPKNLAALYAILDDRERPYYEHRLAA